MTVYTPEYKQFFEQYEKNQKTNNFVDSLMMTHAILEDLKLEFIDLKQAVVDDLPKLVIDTTITKIDRRLEYIKNRLNIQNTII